MKLLPFRPPSLIGPREQPRPEAPAAPGRLAVLEPAGAAVEDTFAPPEGTVSVPDRVSPVALDMAVAVDAAVDVAVDVDVDVDVDVPVDVDVDVPVEVVPVAPRRGARVDNVVPFRRRRAVRRLRRHPLLRWLQPFSLAVVIVVLPVVIAAWFWGSPRFALAEVRITTGGERVPASWVRERMDPFRGRNLLLLPLEKVQERLQRHPWVASISLRKEPPSRLHVRIEERREVALLRRGNELLYLDTAGRPITPFEPHGEEVDLVIVSQRNEDGDPAAALELLRELEVAEVAWLAGLSEILVLGQKDFKIFSTNLPFPLLVRGGTVEHKARRLETLLPQIVARYGSGVEVDLRFPRRIIVQPGPRVADARRIGARPRNGAS